MPKNNTGQKGRNSHSWPIMAIYSSIGVAGAPNSGLVRLYGGHAYRHGNEQEINTGKVKEIETLIYVVRHNAYVHESIILGRGRIHYNMIVYKLSWSLILIVQ